MGEKTKNLVTFDEAVALLQDSGICAFPTDTVFGLGARADNSAAVCQLYGIKNRPTSRPLIVLCADREMVNKLVYFSQKAEKLARLWPGALTLVLPVLPGNLIAPQVNANLDNLGVRIPDDRQLRDLIGALGCPLATTSANNSGQTTARNASDFLAQFGEKISRLDSKHSPLGQKATILQESTILKVTGNEAILLRQGAIPVSLIEQKTGVEIVC